MVHPRGDAPPSRLQAPSNFLYAMATPIYPTAHVYGPAERVFLEQGGFLLPRRLPIPQAPTRLVIGQQIEPYAVQAVAQYYAFTPLNAGKPAWEPGPDIVVPKPDRLRVGFAIADVKPLNARGVRNFWSQIDNWRDKGWRGQAPPFNGRAALFGYDLLGNLYLYGIFQM